MPRIGDVLAERYRVEALLGAGGMAAVYRAMDLRLAREVAVKVLAPNLAADPTFAARFDREARALAAIAHPNVVAVFDVEPGEPASDHEPFYVMELCDGGTLGDRLEANGPMAPTELVPVIAAVAEGLAALHARGLVHRDIKPHNIMFQGGRAKLGDFGLARSEESADTAPLTVTGTTLGTLPFLAPELLGGGVPTPASDVYALAVTAFQALTGRYPKPSDSMREIVEHRHEAPAAVSSIVPALGTAYDALLARALAEDPTARPSAVAFATGLQGALDRLPPSAFADRGDAALAGAAEAPIATGAARITGAAAAGALPAALKAPLDRGTETVIAAPATVASGRASPNPDARRPERAAASRLERRSSTGPDAGIFGSGFVVPLGILLAVLGLVAIVAVTGLLSGDFLGGLPGSSGPGDIGGSQSPGESPSESPGESPSSSPEASPSPTAATPDVAAPALAALQDVISAIRATQGGKGGLTGREVTELEGLASPVGQALSNGDFAAARSATDTLATRADKLAKDLDEARKGTLLDAIATLKDAIPA